MGSKKEKVGAGKNKIWVKVKAEVSLTLWVLVSAVQD